MKEADGYSDGDSDAYKDSEFTFLRHQRNGCNVDVRKLPRLSGRNCIQRVCTREREKDNEGGRGGVANYIPGSLVKRQFDVVGIRVRCTKYICKNVYI